MALYESLYASQLCAMSDQCAGADAQEPVRDESRESHAMCSAWNLLGKRWTFLIVAQLLVRPQSFQELFEHTAGISESMLSERLKELEREGVLQRQVHHKRPIRVTYHLTEKGAALAPVIKAIDTWSRQL